MYKTVEKCNEFEKIYGNTYPVKNIQLGNPAGFPEIYIFKLFTNLTWKNF